MPDRELQHQFVHVLVYTSNGDHHITSDRLGAEGAREDIKAIKQAFGTDQQIDLPWLTCNATQVIAAWTTAS